MIRLMSMATAAFAVLAAPATAQLKVSAWGGFFEETLAEKIYPGFTEATGIEVESIPQPEDTTWLQQISQGAMAGVAPTDLALMTSVPLIQGLESEVWATLDGEAMPNMSGLLPGKTFSSPDGDLVGVGALGFFTTFVTNTDQTSFVPESWADLWSEDFDGGLALLDISDSGLMEVTAVTFFGGYEILETPEGLQQVIDKIAELKPKVSLWFQDEEQLQPALSDGEYSAATYYHDLIVLASFDGAPLASHFPKEGGIGSDAYWVVPAASTQQEEAQAFINYMSQPEVQAAMAFEMGIFPMVSQAAMDMSDEDYALVGSAIPPVTVQTQIHLDQAEFIEDAWFKMVSD